MNIFKKFACCVFVLLSFSFSWGSEIISNIFAAELPIPYLQDLTPTQVRVMWESTLQDAQAEVTIRNERGQYLSFPAQMHKKHPRAQNQFIYEALIDHLKPDTFYQYHLRFNKKNGNNYEFRTAPLKGSQKNFDFYVYSDIQHYADTHELVVKNGVHPLYKKNSTAFILIAGDLVNEGDEYKQYKELFFDPLSILSPKLPIFPAVGNHEYKNLRAKEVPAYFNYFHLPENKSVRYDGHWYSFNYSNAHFISLDTNLGHKIQYKHHPYLFDDVGAKEQVEWLKKDLEKICQDKDLDFVFAYFHHTPYSEVWKEGNLDRYSQEISEQIGQSLHGCHKAGAILAGHVHAYSRGALKEDPLYLITVGPTGGLFDLWEEYENVDLSFIQKSIVSTGFVHIKVKSGKNPNFSITRYGFGTDVLNPYYTGVEDEVLFQKNALPPATPSAVSAQLFDSAGKVEFISSAFFNQSLTHLSSEWEIQMLKNGNWYPYYSTVVDNENVFKEKTDHYLLDKFYLKNMDKSYTYRWRIRYRNNSLIWSQWSKYQNFKL